MTAGWKPHQESLFLINTGLEFALIILDHVAQQPKVTFLAGGEVCMFSDMYRNKSMVFFFFNCIIILLRNPFLWLSQSQAELTVMSSGGNNTLLWTF